MRKFLFAVLLMAGCASTPNAPEPVDRESRDLQGLSGNTLNSVFKTHRTEVRDCYNAALATNPGLKGKVVIAFTVEKAGTISDAEVRGSTMESESFNTCLLNKVKSWKFPEATRTTEVRSYPLYFHPEK